MPRKKKLELVKPQEVKVTFGGKEFEIHPIADRDDDYAYDDSVRFLVLAIPVGTRVFSELMRLGDTNPKAVERIKDATEKQEDTASVILDLVGLLQKTDFGSLLEEVGDTLPKLAAIACHYTDTSVSERDIRNWTKNPFHKDLWNAVIAQMKADNLLAQIGGLQSLLGEFKSA